MENGQIWVLLSTILCERWYKNIPLIELICRENIWLSPYMGLYTEKDPFHEEISTQMEKNTPELLQLNGIIKFPESRQTIIYF